MGPVPYPGIPLRQRHAPSASPSAPWTGRKTIADGADILQYIRDTAAEAGIDRKIGSTTASCGPTGRRPTPAGTWWPSAPTPTAPSWRRWS
ncbi:MAG: hypothetical protein R2699_16730 [Acidimicrobiales bacterium]